MAVAESVVQLRPGRLPNDPDDFLTDIAVGRELSIGNGERGHGRAGSGAALRRDLRGEYGGFHWWRAGVQSPIDSRDRYKGVRATVDRSCRRSRGRCRDILCLDDAPT